MRSVRLDEAMEARLAEASRMTGEAASSIIRKAIEAYCERLVPARLDHRLADVIGTVHSKGGRARDASGSFLELLRRRIRRRVPA